MPEDDPLKQPIANYAWLWQLIMEHRGATMISIISSVVAGIFASTQPYLVGVIVDHVREGASVSQLMTDGALLIGLAILTVMAFYTVRYYSGQVAFQVNYNIRRIIFDNLLTLEKEFFDHYPTGDLVSRMHSDIDYVRRLLLISLTRGGSATFTIFGTFILLATINPLLTIITFVVLFISTSLQLWAGTILAPVFEKSQNQWGVLSAFVQDSVSGIQTIKTTGKESNISQKYYQENIEYRRRWLYFKRRNEPIGMLPTMISELTAGIVVLIGGVMTINEAITLGNFVQFLLYLELIRRGLLQFGTVYQRYQHVRGSLQRITPLLKQASIRDTSNPKKLHAPKGDIEYRDVGVEIDGEWLLKDISLKIKSGSVVAFVGPTGCGKTLLVNLIARVLDPTVGQVLLDNTDIRDIALSDLRLASAYVPQTTFLFSQELHQNVRMGLDEFTDDEIDTAIRISRVSNDLKQLPQGLDTLVGEKGVMLSGGQKQRVAIARAIIRDPAILILDDALSSVDTHTAADILAELRGVLNTRTSLIIAHRIATVKDADHIFVMQNGRIIEDGTHNSLVEQGGDYSQMVERELKEEDRVYGN